VRVEKETIDKLMTRLGRCVGGKLADDVAAAVKEMHADLARAVEENSSMTDAVNRMGDEVSELKTRNRELAEQLSRANALLDAEHPQTSSAIVDALVPDAIAEMNESATEVA
jgi:predicted nuclease with TOPRIM domain